MRKQRGGLLAGKTLRRPVGLKDAVGVADGEGEGVGRLLRAHHLPQDHEALDGFEHGLRAVGGNPQKRGADAGELLLPLADRVFFQFRRERSVPPCQHDRRLQRALHRTEAGSLLRVGFRGDL